MSPPSSARCSASSCAAAGSAATSPPGCARSWAAWPTVLFAGLLFVGVAFERVHYRGSASVASPGKDWRATNERFLDEATGRPVTVWFNPTTGERRYVDE